MSKTLAVGLVIGASLASSVGQSITGVGNKLSQLQKKSERLKVGSALGNDFQVLRAEFLKTSLELSRTGGKNEDLRNKMKSLGEATASAKREAERYGFKIRDVAKQTRYLETASAQAEARIGRMQARMARQQARSQMRGELTATVAVGAAMFAYPVKTFIQFEQAMTEVGAISRASAEDMKKLEENAREMGRATRFTASQAAGAQKNLANMGFSPDEIVTTMPGMLDLAAAGGLELENAASISSDILNAFNMAKTEVARVGDVLALSAASSGTNIEQMAYAMKYAAPDAKALGFSIEQTAAVISKLSDAGIKGEMAGTTLRAVYSRLVNPIGDAGKFLDFLGVKTLDSKGKLKEVPALIKEIDAAMTKRGFGSGEKARGMKTIFGEQAGTGAMALSDAAKSGELDQLTEQYRNAKGASREMAERMDDTTRGSILRLGSAVESLALDFKGAFEPSIKPAINTLADFVNCVGQFVKKNPGMAKALVGVAAGFVGMKAASLVGRIGISHLMDGFSLLNGGFQMLRPSTIQAAIGIMRMRGVGGVLRGITAPFRLFGRGMLKDLGALKSGAMFLGKGLLSPFKFLATGLKVVGASMMANPIVWIIGAVVAAVVVAGYLIYRNWATVKRFFVTMWDGVKVKWEAAKTIFTTWWDGVKAGWDTLGEAIKKPFIIAFEWLGGKIDWVKSKWEGFKSVFSSGPSAISGPSGNLPVGASLPGHAIGGVFNKPHIAAFSEGGREEAAIALEGGNLDRSRSIWAYSGEKLGMFDGQKGSGNTSSGSISIAPGAIVIHAAPGMDVNTLANEVLRKLERLIAQKIRKVVLGCCSRSVILDSASTLLLTTTSASRRSIPGRRLTGSATHPSFRPSAKNTER